MIFGVLGHLVILDGGRSVTVPAAKQRVILAALILDANRVVPVDDLVDLVWDGSPPPSHRAALHNYLTRLRRSMGALGPRLVTRSPGYVLELGAADADERVFATLACEAQAAVDARAWERVAGLTRQALALWRGTPLIDVPSEALCREWVPSLVERRLQLIEWRIEADLRLGHEAQLVVELRPLIAKYPLRERFHSQLMVALYRCGRQAEALTVYQDARRLLVAELGIEPGPELQRTHRGVLKGQVALACVAV